jgi:Haloacid dehalogenase-like hydrolase
VRVEIRELAHVVDLNVLRRVTELTAVGEESTNQLIAFRRTRDPQGLVHQDGLLRALLTPQGEAAGVDDLLSVRISADDADASKPDADPIEAALQRLQARAAETILLGDTPTISRQDRKQRWRQSRCALGGLQAPARAVYGGMTRLQDTLPDV